MLSSHRSHSILQTALLLTTTAIVLLISYYLVDIPHKTTAFSNQDFEKYWCGLQAFWSNKNPYELGAQIHAFQSVCTLEHLWNPPSLFLVLAPLQFFDLPIARTVWICAQFLFTFLLLRELLFIQYGTKKISENIALLFTALFTIPLYFSFQYGQLSVMLSYVAMVSFRMAHEKKFLYALLLLLILSIKPTLFLPIGFTIALLSLRQSPLKDILIPTLLFGGILILLYLLNDWALEHWISRRAFPINHPTETYAYRLRSLHLIEDRSFEAYFYLITFPLTGLILTSTLLFKRLQKGMTEYFPLLCGISIIFAPYGSIFDFALISVVIWDVLHRSRALFLGKRSYLYLILAITGLSSIFKYFEQYATVWIAACAILTLLSARKQIEVITYDRVQ